MDYPTHRVIELAETVKFKKIFMKTPVLHVSENVEKKFGKF